MTCLDDLVLRATTDPLVILPCKIMSYMQGYRFLVMKSCLGASLISCNMTPCSTTLVLVGCSHVFHLCLPPWGSDLSKSEEDLAQPSNNWIIVMWI